MVASGLVVWARASMKLLVVGAVTAALGCGGSSKHAGDDDDSGTPNDGGKGGALTGGKGSGGTTAGGSGGTTAGGSGGAAADGGSGMAASGSVDPTKTLVGLTTEQLDKVDLLLMIDNSLSMSHKQELLAEAVPVLVERLVQPACVDADGNVMGQAAPDGACPAFTAPEFRPVRNLHVGVITSSLGDHGSGDICSAAQDAANQAQGGRASHYNDLAELLPSVRTGLQSWNNSGFLVWDPRVQSEVLDPHPNLTQNETNPSAFVANLTNQITAADQRGCGYEASLEAWYRFLVDPEPVATMTHDSTSSTSVRGAANSVVLAQRAAFLRPDSAVMIVMLTDENDCSIADEDGTQGWLVGYKGGVNAGTLWHMPRASAACATSPDDPCCRPCSSSPSPGCPGNDTDGSCALGAVLSVPEDSMNLRCFAQMERFGIDLLYPTERYTEALTKVIVRPRFGGATVPNPLFQASDDAPPREPGLVIFGGILGVPWQDLSTADSWDGEGLEYLDASELAVEGRWDVILGDPKAHRPPTDTLMVESVEPRTDLALAQEHPLLGATLGAADSTTLTNPINGHEQAVLPVRDDLQYACIFELSNPVRCTDGNADACDCNVDEFNKNSPLCEGLTATSDGTQRFAKAYPSLRQLEVLKSVGDGAVVASICPKYTLPHAGTTKITDPSYGYNAAVDALVKKLRPIFGPRCLPWALPVDEHGARVACSALEARPTEGECGCTLAGRTDAESAEVRSVRARLAEWGYCDAVGAPACDDYCVCEITQLDGAALERCQMGVADGGTDYGFCYVDPEQGIGSDAVVASCEDSSKRLLRFLGDGLPQRNAVTVLDCTAN